MSHPWTKISIWGVFERITRWLWGVWEWGYHKRTSDLIQSCWMMMNQQIWVYRVPFRWTHNEPWKGPHLSGCSYLAWQAKHVVFDKRRYAVRLFLSFHQINDRNTMKYVEMNKCSKISKFNTEVACSGWFSRHITHVQTSWKKGAV